MAAQEQVKAAKEQTVSSNRQANASDTQTTLSQKQTGIAQTQFEQSQPRLLFSVSSTGSAVSFMIGKEKQKDDFEQREKNPAYRAIIEIDIANLSSLPISVMNMFLIFEGTEHPVWKSVTNAEKYYVRKGAFLEIKNKEYPDVFVLQPYEAMRKWAIFPSEHCPSVFPAKATLNIQTSRGTFSQPVIFYKQEGLSDNPEPNDFVKGVNLFKPYDRNWIPPEPRFNPNLKRPGST